MNVLRTLKFAVVGLVIGGIVGLVPMVGAVGPLVGGAVAGYLHGPGVKGGTITGAAVGLLGTFLTLVLFLLAIAVGMGRGTIGGLDWLPAAGGGVWVGVLFVVGFGVLVGMTAVGGALGAIVAAERHGDQRPRLANH